MRNGPATANEEGEVAEADVRPRIFVGGAGVGVTGLEVDVDVNVEGTS